MTSIASTLGFEETELRQRTISLVAYAWSNRELQFPEPEEHLVRTAGYPSSVSDGLLMAEAAMAMAGAASCALTIDQRIGVRLALEAATLYARAGQPYAAFLQGALGRLEARWTDLAGRVAEEGLAQSDLPAQLFAPTQLAYLGLGVAFTGTPWSGLQVLRYAPSTVAIGPGQIPVGLLSRFLGEMAERPDHGSPALVTYLTRAVEQDQLASQRMADYRRLLPWNLSLPLDSIFLLTHALPGPSVDRVEDVIDRERDEFGERLTMVAFEIKRQIAMLAESAEEPLEGVLRDWLA